MLIERLKFTSATNFKIYKRDNNLCDVSVRLMDTRIINLYRQQSHTEPTQTISIYLSIYLSIYIYIDR